MNRALRSNATPIVISMVLLALTGCGSSSATPSPSPSGFKTVSFPNGSVQFSIPEAYSHRTEPDGTIAITPSDEIGITLRLNLHNLPDAVAEEFLQSQAKDKGLQLTRIGGKATISENGTRSEGGRNFEMTFWQIGFGDCLVVMSAEVDKKHRVDQTVKECFIGVPKIIESFQKY